MVSIEESRYGNRCSSAKHFKTCGRSETVSFSTISDKGNRVHGIAAFLVESKRHGGVDAFIGEIAADAASIALKHAIQGGIKHKAG